MSKTFITSKFVIISNIISKFFNYFINEKQFRKIFKYEIKDSMSYSYRYNHASVSLSYITSIKISHIVMTIINGNILNELYIICSNDYHENITDVILIKRNFYNNKVKVYIYSIRYQDTKNKCKYKYYKNVDISDINNEIKKEMEEKRSNSDSLIKLKKYKPNKKKINLNLPRCIFMYSNLLFPRNISLIMQQGSNLPFLLDVKNKKILKNNKFVNYFEDD